MMIILTSVTHSQEYRLPFRVQTLFVQLLYTSSLCGGQVLIVFAFIIRSVEHWEFEVALHNSRQFDAMYKGSIVHEFCDRTNIIKRSQEKDN